MHLKRHICRSYMYVYEEIELIHEDDPDSPAFLELIT